MKKHYKLKIKLYIAENKGLRKLYKLIKYDWRH